MKRLICSLAIVGFAGFLGHAAQAQTKQIALSEAENPVCGKPLKFDDKTGSCTLPADQDLNKLDEKSCPGLPGFSFESDKCKFDAKKAPAPTCDKVLANLVYDATSKKCQLVVGQPTSGAGDYVGDCFKLVMSSSDGHLKAGSTYTVTGQQETSKDDRALTLVEGQMNWLPVPGLFGCNAEKGPVLTANASTLMEGGAKRYGWAYGVLTMPYKYYPGSKNFVTGLPPIGGYLGWRTGRAEIGRASCRERV